MPPAEQQSKGVGPLVGALLIVVLLVIGAFYFFQDRAHRSNTAPLPLIPGDATSTQ